MSRSKWDKISREDVCRLTKRIRYIDIDYHTGQFMAFNLQSIDPYIDKLTDLNTFQSVARDSLNEIHAQRLIYAQNDWVITVAEVFAQMPQEIIHKVDAFRALHTTSMKDYESGKHSIMVLFYQDVEKAKELVDDGPLTARTMYRNLLNQAMLPHSERTGMMLHTSLPDGYRDKKHREWVDARIAEVDSLTDEQLVDAIASFWLKAFRQR